MKTPKVFGIGLSKTGTSSLRDALILLDYNVARMNKRLTHKVLSGGISSALDVSEHFDAFEDMPWPLLFRELFAKYGTSARYVLTVRSSAEVWVASMKKHQLQNHIEKAFSPRRTVYGPAYAFGFEREYTAFYEAHNQSVREFFAAQNASHVLLEACWERGDGWPELCRLLECHIPDVPFPHANADADRPKWRFRRFAHGVAAHLYAGMKGRRVTERVFSGKL